MPISKTMTLTQFDNGYWFAVELKAFARSIGIASPSALRKDELETAIKHYLRTGTIRRRPGKRPSTPRVKDVDRGLRLDLPVLRYTNDKETKEFLEREALKLAPALKKRSGARYRLNRWREKQIAKGAKLTYRGLVAEYVRLSQRERPFARIPHGRYINFVSAFMASSKGGTMREAIQAWQTLKTLDVPKTFAAWFAHGRPTHTIVSGDRKKSG